MKKYLLTLLLLIFNTALLLSQGKIFIEGGDTVNWGQVKLEASPLQKNVIIKNIGQDTLKIYRTKPSCGCTTSKLERTSIPTDSSAVLEITLNLGSMPGPITKTITIRNNDPDNPDKTIYLMAEVIFPLKYNPYPFIGFSDMMVDSASSGKITISNTTQDTITIKDVKVEPEYLTVNIKAEAKILPNSSIELIAIVSPKKTGPFSGMIKIKTDHPEVVRVEIPARGMVLKDRLQILEKK